MKEMKSQLNLLTALGNPTLVWEMVDFFNGGDRFAYNREAAGIRSGFAGRGLGEIHLFCTGGVMGDGRRLADKLGVEYPEIRVKLVPLSCDDICCSSDNTAMREIVYKTVKNLSGPDLVIASGGRKTVTQRLMEAAIMYGCAGYLTMTAPREIEKKGKEARSHTDKFNVIWTPAASFYEEKQHQLIRDELGDTFRSLYLLPVSLVKRLREERLGVDRGHEQEERSWLRGLPKTDLHCHLGGCYDFALLRELAKILLADLGISVQRQREIAGKLASRLKTPLADLCANGLRDLDPGAIHCLANLQKLYTDIKEDTHVVHAVLVTSLTEKQLADLATDCGRKAGADPLELYMKSGDLGGSNLLQTKNTLRRAVAWAVRHAAADGVRYLEIRFSPGNYTRARLSIEQVVDIVTNEAARQTEAETITVHFLIMATRHKDAAEMDKHVQAAVAAFNRGTEKSRVVGFDLAGQEEDNPPENFQDIFESLHKKFVNITIHAGEMDREDKIWQAMYRLHAKRIGHGLKLENDKSMMNYIRDWGITLEMCPTSNRQTNGFRRYDHDEDGGIYPLKKYLDHGIRVTVNTDNPGISDTSASRELLTAARMTEGGLSRWDILRLVRHGFKAVFLPRDEKDRLLKEIDDRIFAIILDNYYPERT